MHIVGGLTFGAGIALVFSEPIGWLLIVIGAITLVYSFFDIKMSIERTPKFQMQEWLSKQEWLDYNELRMEQGGVNDIMRERYEQTAYERYQRANGVV